MQLSRQPQGWASELMLAAAEPGSAQRITDLLQCMSCPSVNHRDLEGRTALHIAVQCRNHDVIPLLVKAGLFMNYVDNKGLTALALAASLGHTGTVRLLLDLGADILLTTIIRNCRPIPPLTLTAVGVAVRAGQLHIARLLVQRLHETRQLASYIKVRVQQLVTVREVLEKQEEYDAHLDTLIRDCLLSTMAFLTHNLTARFHVLNNDGDMRILELVKLCVEPPERLSFLRYLLDCALSCLCTTQDRRPWKLNRQAVAAFVEKKGHKLLLAVLQRCAAPKYREIKEFCVAMSVPLFYVYNSDDQLPKKQQVLAAIAKIPRRAFPNIKDRSEKISKLEEVYISAKKKFESIPKSKPVLTPETKPMSESDQLHTIPELVQKVQNDTEITSRNKKDCTTFPGKMTEVSHETVQLCSSFQKSPFHLIEKQISSSCSTPVHPQPKVMQDSSDDGQGFELVTRKRDKKLRKKKVKSLAAAADRNSDSAADTDTDSTSVVSSPAKLNPHKESTNMKPQNTTLDQDNRPKTIVKVSSNVRFSFPKKVATISQSVAKSIRYEQTKKQQVRAQESPDVVKSANTGLAVCGTAQTGEHFAFNANTSGVDKPEVQSTSVDMAPEWPSLSQTHQMKSKTAADRSLDSAPDTNSTSAVSSPAKPNPYIEGSNTKSQNTTLDQDNRPKKIVKVSSNVPVSFPKKIATIPQSVAKSIRYEQTKVQQVKALESPDVVKSANTGVVVFGTAQTGDHSASRASTNGVDKREEQVTSVDIATEWPTLSQTHPIMKQKSGTNCHDNTRQIDKTANADNKTAKLNPHKESTNIKSQNTTGDQDTKPTKIVKANSNVRFSFPKKVATIPQSAAVSIRYEQTKEHKVRAQEFPDVVKSANTGVVECGTAQTGERSVFSANTSGVDKREEQVTSVDIATEWPTLSQTHQMKSQTAADRNSDSVPDSNSTSAVSSPAKLNPYIEGSNTKSQNTSLDQDNRPKKIVKVSSNVPVSFPKKIATIPQSVVKSIRYEQTKVQVRAQDSPDVVKSANTGVVVFGTAQTGDHSASRASTNGVDKREEQVTSVDMATECPTLSQTHQIMKQKSGTICHDNLRQIDKTANADNKTHLEESVIFTTPCQKIENVVNPTTNPYSIPQMSANFPVSVFQQLHANKKKFEKNQNDLCTKSTELTDEMYRKSEGLVSRLTPEAPTASASIDSITSECSYKTCETSLSTESFVDAESETETESERTLQTETETETENERTLQTETKTEAESERTLQTETETETESERTLQTETETETESQRTLQTETETETESQRTLQTGTKTETESERTLQTETETKKESERTLQTEHEMETESERTMRLETKTETESERILQSEIEMETESESTLQTETKTETESENTLQTETETETESRRTLQTQIDTATESVGSLQTETESVVGGPLDSPFKSSVKTAAVTQDLKLNQVKEWLMKNERTTKFSLARTQDVTSPDTQQASHPATDDSKSNTKSNGTLPNSCPLQTEKSPICIFSSTSKQLDSTEIMDSPQANHKKANKSEKQEIGKTKNINTYEVGAAFGRRIKYDFETKNTHVLLLTSSTRTVDKGGIDFSSNNKSSIATTSEPKASVVTNSNISDNDDIPTTAFNAKPDQTAAISDHTNNLPLPNESTQRDATNNSNIKNSQINNSINNLCEHSSSDTPCNESTVDELVDTGSSCTTIPAESKPSDATNNNIHIRDKITTEFHQPLPEHNHDKSDQPDEFSSNIPSESGPAPDSSALTNSGMNSDSFKAMPDHKSSNIPSEIPTVNKEENDISNCKTSSIATPVESKPSDATTNGFEDGTDISFESPPEHNQTQTDKAEESPTTVATHCESAPCEAKNSSSYIKKEINNSIGATAEHTQTQCEERGETGATSSVPQTPNSMLMFSNSYDSEHTMPALECCANGADAAQMDEFSITDTSASSRRYSYAADDEATTDEASANQAWDASYEGDALVWQQYTIKPAATHSLTSESPTKIQQIKFAEPEAEEKTALKTNHGNEVDGIVQEIENEVQRLKPKYTSSPTRNVVLQNYLKRICDSSENERCVENSGDTCIFTTTAGEEVISADANEENDKEGNGSERPSQDYSTADHSKVKLFVNKPSKTENKSVDKSVDNMLKIENGKEKKNANNHIFTFKNRDTITNEIQSDSAKIIGNENQENQINTEPVPLMKNMYSSLKHFIKNAEKTGSLSTRKTYPQIDKSPDESSLQIDDNKSSNDIPKVNSICLSKMDKEDPKKKPHEKKQDEEDDSKRDDDINDKTEETRVTSLFPQTLTPNSMFMFSYSCEVENANSCTTKSASAPLLYTHTVEHNDTTGQTTDDVSTKEINQSKELRAEADIIGSQEKEKKGKSRRRKKKSKSSILLNTAIDAGDEHSASSTTIDSNEAENESNKNTSDMKTQQNLHGIAINENQDSEHKIMGKTKISLEELGLTLTPPAPSSADTSICLQDDSIIEAGSLYDSSLTPRPQESGQLTPTLGQGSCQLSIIQNFIEQLTSNKQDTNTKEAEEKQVCVDMIQEPNDLDTFEMDINTGSTIQESQTVNITKHQLSTPIGEASRLSFHRFRTPGCSLQNCIDIDPFKIQSRDSEATFAEFEHDPDPLFDNVPTLGDGWYKHILADSGCGDELAALLCAQRRCRADACGDGQGSAEDQIFKFISHEPDEKGDSVIGHTGLSRDQRDMTVNYVYASNIPSQNGDTFLSPLQKGRALASAERKDSRHGCIANPYASTNMSYWSQTSSVVHEGSNDQFKQPPQDYLHRQMKGEFPSYSPEFLQAMQEMGIENELQDEKNFNEFCYENEPGPYQSEAFNEIRSRGAQKSASVAAAVGDDGLKQPPVSESRSLAHLPNTAVNTDDTSSKYGVAAWSRWRQCAGLLLDTLPALLTRVRDVHFAQYARFKVGAGAAGSEVYLGLDAERRVVAVKRVAKLYLADRAPRLSLITDSRLQHPNILSLRNFYQDLTYGYLITELCESNLEHYLSSLPCDGIAHGHVTSTEHVTRRLCREMVHGLAFLHAHGLHHGALTPSNVLIDSRGQVRLADFCVMTAADTAQLLSRACASPDTSMTRSRLIWLAPLHFTAKIHTAADMLTADLQSLALLMHYALTCGEHAYGDEVDSILTNLHQGRPQLRPIPPDAQQLISHLLTQQPPQPRVAACLLNHPFTWIDRTSYLVNLCEVCHQYFNGYLLADNTLAGQTVNYLKNQSIRNCHPRISTSLLRDGASTELRNDINIARLLSELRPSHEVINEVVKMFPDILKQICYSTFEFLSRINAA